MSTQLPFVRSVRIPACAFTLVELMLVIAIIGILAALLLPSISRGTQASKRVKCAQQLGQFNLALLIYADENDDEAPRRCLTPSWIDALRENYSDARLLRCPQGQSAEERTYIMNSFSDWFQENLPTFDFIDFKEYLWPGGMRLTAIPEPSETIAFGEKLPSSPHVHMDFFQGAGNDLEEVDHGRHPTSRHPRGGANFAFIDGSVRTVPFFGSVTPVNRWAVTAAWRYAPVTVP